MSYALLQVYAHETSTAMSFDVIKNYQLLEDSGDTISNSKSASSFFGGKKITNFNSSNFSGLKDEILRNFEDDYVSDFGDED